MKKAQYPSKSCRQPMSSEQGLGYNCELALEHEGPHATFSIGYSVKGRDAWEAQHPEQAESTTSNDMIHNKKY